MHASSALAWLGIDTGGTFTDFVLLSQDQPIRTHKVPSTPAAPEHAIFQGIEDMGLTPCMRAGELLIVHGTTVATNAALEGKGARTVFITNQGFEDLLLIGRQTRPQLYQLCTPPATHPVSRTLCLGSRARLNAQGDEVTPLTEAELDTLAEQVRQLQPEAIAISTLFSYLNPRHEQQLAERLAPLADFVCHSADLLPISGEYERGLTTWLNAWLGPRVSRYMTQLRHQAAPSTVTIMQSHGGTLSIDQAGERAANLLLSGPAGGLCATRLIQRDLGEAHFMTFDMGGTSSDVALILDGDIKITLEGHINQLPVAMPMVDMHTIGAGGGSIAQVDDAGMLHVGPHSAGADPGPACYGKGGTLATVTDANLVLGRLQPAFALGGTMTLDADAATRAVQAVATALGLPLMAAAHGIIELANEHMAQALRVISIQKGHRPADFRLVSFGGAGGLHVCALADKLGMHKAVVPAHAGVLSALGMLLAPRQIEQAESLQLAPSRNASARDTQIDQHLERLWQYACSRFAQDKVDTRTLQHVAVVEMRYQGQTFTLDVPWRGSLAEATDDFHHAHRQRYGHQMNLPVEVARIRSRVFADQPVPPPQTRAPRPFATPWMTAQVYHGTQPESGRAGEPAGLAVPVYARDTLADGQQCEGPALVTEAVATTWIPPGWRAEQHPSGHLLLDKLPCEDV